MPFENAFSPVANTAPAVSASVDELFEFLHMTLFGKVKEGVHFCGT